MRRARLVGLAAAFAFAGCGGTATSPATPPAPTDGGSSTEDAGVAALSLLQPGEVADVTVTGGKAGVRLATPLGTEKFIVVLASAQLASSSAKSTSFVPYAVATGADAAPATGTRVASSCSLTSDPWRGKSLPAEAPPTGTAPAVGTTRTLSVTAGGSTESITAKVAAVSKTAVVWLDTTPAHPATLEASFIDAFLAEFDATIVPRERAIFGVESDVDGDGRIGLVFTPLTKDAAVAFFFQCDLLATAGCPAGNKGEMLYLTPPADIAPPYNTPAAIKEILAHELGHLLHFNRKVLRNKLTRWPDGTYMIEGLGGFAQDVVGYQAGNLYVTQAALDGIAGVSLTDVLDDGAATDTKRDGVLRGGGYLFVRYLYDRAGGDAAQVGGAIESRGGPALLRALLDAPASVAETIPTITSGGATAADVAMDFYTALAISNADGAGVPAAKHSHAAVNPCFAFLPTALDPVTGKPRGTNLFAEFHGQGMSGPAMKPIAQAGGKLRAGGVDYLTVDATAEQPEIALSIAADADVRVRVVRRD